MSDGAVIAARILESDGEPFATLSLANGLPPVTISTAIADARRNYMRLAALIHPDKIKGEFEKSTEAFQCLVKAFETFVDPKLRKRAAAVLEKSKKQGTGEVKATTDKKQKDKIDKQKRKAKHKVAALEKAEIAKHDKSAEVTKRKKKTKEEQEEEEDDEDDFVEKDSEEESESDEDEDESQAGEEGEDWEDKFLADDIEPAVSTSRTPIGVARVGGVYTQTIIGCPNCRTRWEPDSKPQYSLFMGKWGKKVHCQLCLFVFGSASALHNCPHCDSAFDYDASMYDSTITCAGCKREIGFPYYPVNQMLIDNLALEQWRARKEAEKIKERELRARQRHGLGATDHNNFKSSSSKGNNNKSSSSHKTQRADENEEEMLTLVGTCVVEDECPLCHQRIKRNHRTHVEECIKLTPEQRKEAKRTRKATVNDNISGNQQNSKKETVLSTRKRARLSTTQTKESEDSVNNINAKNTKGKAKQPAKVPSLSTSSSSTAKNSKSGNKQPSSRQRRRGKRNHSDDDDNDESEEEESLSDDDSEDNDESDEEDEFTESDDDEDDDDDE